MVALAATLAGCGGTDPDSSTPPATAPVTSAADPVTVIQQAMDRSLSSTVTLDASVKGSGVSMEIKGRADPAARTLQVTGTVPEPVEMRVIGDVAYIKQDSSSGDKPWIKVDLTKLRPNSPLRQSLDIEAQTGIIGGIVTAQPVGEGRYRGTADLDRAAEAAGTNAGLRGSLESSAKLAKDPKAIPFEATVDAEGRLTELSYTIATEKLGDFTSAVRMSGFGTAVTVTAPPAGETEDAPPELYKIF